jgi:hypothetical protein
MSEYDENWEKFRRELSLMINTRKYNEDAMNSLITLIAGTELISEDTTKDADTREKMREIAVVAQKLAERLYKLKERHLN